MTTKEHTHFLSHLRHHEVLKMDNRKATKIDTYFLAPTVGPCLGERKYVCNLVVFHRFSSEWTLILLGKGNACAL